MNEKELVRVAYLIQEALVGLRKSRYLECVRQLSLFTGSLHEIAHGSRQMAVALSRDWFAASEECCKSVARHLGQIPYNVSKLESLMDRRHKEVPSLGTILAELKAIQEEFDDVAFNSDEGALSVITESITLEDTLGYELTQGEVSEQQLYDETTDYLRFVYNKAKLLNRTAARLAMSVFQRRMASSTYALLRSFERRLEKLDRLIADVQEGRFTMEQLLTLQQRLAEEEDVFDAQTADEEAPAHGVEGNELCEDRLLQGVVAASLADLLAEKKQVQDLLQLAKQVYERPGTESKFERLRGVLTDPRWADEKFIVFTEHRDTLYYLVRRLEGMGYTGHIAQIHGGMDYQDRDEQVERFRKSHHEGGCRILVATDAAGEGINLQFCWLMVNWDIPWNPARLEQRMGRIHRYGQQHDPVVILNLIAPATREGRVLKTLLDKLEAIRKELKSDKVYDVIGRVFQGVSITQYMEQALAEGPEIAAQQIEGYLTKEQIEAIAAREKVLYGTGGDVAKELPRLRESLEQETYYRLLPGYVRQFIEKAAPLVGVDLDGDPSDEFALRPAMPGAIDAILPALETYPPAQRDRLSVSRPADKDGGIWLHPGETVFESFRQLVEQRLGRKALQGAVFIDPTARKPYLFHLARLSVTSNYLLYRVRRFGRALAAMGVRIARTAPTPDAIRYRLLRDPLGPVHLAETLSCDGAQREGEFTPAEAGYRLYALAEMVLSLGHVGRHIQRVAGRDAKWIMPLFLEARETLRTTARRLQEQAGTLPDDLNRYLDTAFAENARLLDMREEE